MKTTWIAMALLASCAAFAGEGDARAGTPPRLVVAKGPEYPDEERKAGHEGRVVFTFTVTKMGKVENLQLETSSGFPGLDAAALEAARAWKFTPGKGANGKPVDTALERAMAFNLPEDPMDVVNQSCAQIAQEVTTLRATKPDARPVDAPSFAKAGRTLLFTVMDRGIKATEADVMMKLGPFFDAVYADCERTPASRFDDALARNVDVLLDGAKPAK